MADHTKQDDGQRNQGMKPATADPAQPKQQQQGGDADTAPKQPGVEPADTKLRDENTQQK